MSSVLYAEPLPCRSSQSGRVRGSLDRGTSRRKRRPEEILTGGRLASYVDIEGGVRELLAVPGHAGSALVLDRDASTLGDRRLVAHLAPDEPHENAAVVARQYVADERGRWCRKVRPEDLTLVPFDEEESEDGSVADRPGAGIDRLPCLVDGRGTGYRLGLLSGAGAARQLRWCRRRSRPDDPRHSRRAALAVEREIGRRMEPADLDTSEWELASLREVVAALESYEPACTHTAVAITAYRQDTSVSRTRLRRELERLRTSPVVLNRGLREAVVDAVNSRGLSMSEIALRCGVVKRDRRGKLSGETSWLARRIGIMPEGGRSETTPWVHSDVLASIAREGLGISPREVELQ